MVKIDIKIPMSFNKTSNDNIRAIYLRLTNWTIESSPFLSSFNTKIFRSKFKCPIARAYLSKIKVSNQHYNNSNKERNEKQN